MLHPILVFTVSALVLVLATPAAAALRTARFEWVPAPGPVAGYAVFASVDGGGERLYDWVTTPSAEVAVASGAALRVRVAAFDLTGALGPRSDVSASLRLCPGDFDGDGLIALTDAGHQRNCFGQAAVGPCSAGDLDFDDFVGLRDLNSLAIGAAACPPDSLCPGDFNEDGVIGTSDVNAVRNCLGLLPEGSCEPADMDGNGFVGNLDVILVYEAFGTLACES